jgi:hypothetical protein
MTGAHVPEAEFQRQVIDLAHLYGWRAFHARPGRTSSGGWATHVAADGKGFPDLTLVRDRVVFVELKSANGQLTAEQDEWIRALEHGDAEVYVWRPNQFDELHAILKERADA